MLAAENARLPEGRAARPSLSEANVSSPRFVGWRFDFRSLLFLAPLIR